MADYVVVKELTKHYGEFCAVDHLSFQVEEGEIFGLLGPNGAGKSTTMNIITTLDSFSSGQVTVNGLDVVKDQMAAKRLIGMVPQEIAVYPHLTALENVTFFALLYGLKGQPLKDAALEALAFVGLSDRKGMKPKEMSGGMMRRLNIACGIAHRPKLIIMDEPTVGVDAQSREHILGSIKTLKERGATIIYTSHYMNEVEEICDRIAIIDHGQMVACGTEEELVSLITEYKSFTVATRFPADFDEKAFIKEASTLPTVHAVVIEESTLRFDTTLACSDFSLILEQIRKAGLPILSASSEAPNLDMVFLTLTGHDMR